MSHAKTPKTLDAEQQESLLDALLRRGAPKKTERKGIRNHLIGCLMLDAGLRVGEVVKLKMSHLYFCSLPVKTIVLTKTITKNHRERTVPVSERLSMSLRSYFSAWLVTDIVNNCSFTFYYKSEDHPLTTRQVENIINTAGYKAFGQPVNPHMLRHTFASQLLRVTNIRTVQELLGHNYVTSTQIYTHPNEDDKRKAIDELQKDVTVSGQDLEECSGSVSS